jgi:uncharacterized RDD family membrane protein YckC
LSLANLQSRLFAKFTDLLVVVLLGLIVPGGIGALLGFFYSLVADGLPFRKFHGQSLGKKLLGIRVTGQGGKGIGLKSSVIRNIPVGLVTLLMVVPFWGWILSFLVGIPLGLIELSLIARAKERQRLGDVMAETLVVRAVSPASKVT